uniref:Ceramidase n=1 Tax=Pithovirus LCPAC001 TaxID=2506585 RepID=A0A481Z1H0_9VIRU|nr:MAG: hypothetical protein LCPAC001_00620 [Pithovirus LCPAC001]
MATLSIFAATTFSKNFNWNLPNRISNFTLCEQPSSKGFSREPYNVFSSLFFTSTYIFPLFFSIQDAFLDKNEYKTIISRYPKFSFVYGLVCLFHAAGTTFGHMCACNLGLILDNTFLWSMLGWNIFISLYIHVNASRPYHRWYLLAFIIYTAGCSFIASYSEIILLQTVMTTILIVAIITINIVGIYKNKKVVGRVGYFWTSFILTLFGIICAALDPIICHKNSFGTHSLWHIMGSFAILFLYVYIWSVKDKESINLVSVSESQD